MKITAKTSFAGSFFSAVAGQVLTLPDAVAEDLIKAKFAEPVNAPKKAEAVKDEDKRDNSGSDTKPAPRKRTGTKRR